MLTIVYNMSAKSSSQLYLMSAKSVHAKNDGKRGSFMYLNVKINFHQIIKLAE